MPKDQHNSPLASRGGQEWMLWFGRASQHLPAARIGCEADAIERPGQSQRTRSRRAAQHVHLEQPARFVRPLNWQFDQQRAFPDLARRTQRRDFRQLRPRLEVG